MALNFSAEQFEDRYKSTRLNNWEVPKPPAGRPVARKGYSKILSDARGHLLKDSYKKPNSSPWSNFRSTWEFPDRLTRRFSDEYKDCIESRSKWKSPKFCTETHNNLPDVTGTAVNCPTKCDTLKPFLNSAYEKNKFDYVPGDLTPTDQQHPSRQLLLEQKYAEDTGLEPNVPLAKLNLGDAESRVSDYHKIEAPTDTKLLPQSQGLVKPLVSPAIPEDLGIDSNNIDIDLDNIKMPHDNIAAKPNERCPSPIVPAYMNFEIAKRMHYGNLDHQPLPDCIADLAFRKAQITGGPAGLALDIDPIATGVGIKTHNAGPTHCTKMRVYRPKTCGVTPKPYNADDDFSRPYSSSHPTKPMGAMDLAIGWDYRPANPADEPRPAKHIDGSNESTGPAVFTYVKTPRDEAKLSTGRSAGVFNNTLGESDFFDKDIMRRKADFAGHKVNDVDPCRCSPPLRAQSVTRRPSSVVMPSQLGNKQFKSTPNLLNHTELLKLREQYLGPDVNCPTATRGRACKREKVGGGFLQRARARLCHKVAPTIERACNHVARCVPSKAFRVGIPHYDAAGHFISSDSGCSSSSGHGMHAIAVPRPRIPYSKRNYDIDTLVPPFRCLGGGAGEGGYPEHWRLSSVYQQAFKPLEQRRRPLIHTVYK